MSQEAASRAPLALKLLPGNTKKFGGLPLTPMIEDTKFDDLGKGGILLLDAGEDLEDLDYLLPIAFIREIYFLQVHLSEAATPLLCDFPPERTHGEMSNRCMGICKEFP